VIIAVRQRAIFILSLLSPDPSRHYSTKTAREGARVKQNTRHRRAN
jgi:hypothetical protein